MTVPVCGGGSRFQRLCIVPFLCYGVSRQNNPLFLQTVDGTDHILFHHIVHACVDTIDEKCACWPCCLPLFAIDFMSNAPLGTDKPRLSHNTDLYLGFLAPVDDCRMFVDFARVCVLCAVSLTPTPSGNTTGMATSRTLR